MAVASQAGVVGVGDLILSAQRSQSRSRSPRHRRSPALLRRACGHVGDDDVTADAHGVAVGVADDAEPDQAPPVVAEHTAGVRDAQPMDAATITSAPHAVASDWHYTGGLAPAVPLSWDRMFDQFIPAGPPPDSPAPPTPEPPSNHIDPDGSCDASGAAKPMAALVEPGSPPTPTSSPERSPLSVNSPLVNFSPTAHLFSDSGEASASPVSKCASPIAQLVVPLHQEGNRAHVIQQLMAAGLCKQNDMLHDITSDADAVDSESDEDPFSIHKDEIHVRDDLTNAQLNDHEKAVCTTLRDCFDWPGQMMDVLLDRCPEGVLQRLGYRLQSLTYSTSFSGIDSPGVALAQIEACLSDRLGKHLDGATHVRAFECNSECIAELKMHPHCPAHIYTDIFDVFSPNIREKIELVEKSNMPMTLEAFLPLIHNPNSVNLECGVRCVWHKGCSVSHGDIEIAGTPCVDWSPRGNRGKDGGTSMKLYAAWAAMCLKQDIPIIVHENSHMLDPSFNEKVFGHKYLVESMKLEPQSFGWPTARPRRWTVMTHRVQVLEAYSTLANVVPLFYRVCRTTWHSYFVSSLTEKLEELQWACARKNSSAAAHEYVPSIHDVESSDSWIIALTEAEVESYLAYVGKHGMDRVFQLNQDGATSFGAASTATCLHTLIRNSGIQFSPSQNLPHKQWLTAKDMLVAHGFPMNAEWTDVRYSKTIRRRHLCTSFHFQRYSDLPRNRKALAEMNGNTMHVNCCGAVLMYCLINFVRSHEMSVEEFIESNFACPPLSSSS